MTTTPQETRGRLWPEADGSQVTGLLYASIWLVLLVMPVVATALSEADFGWKLTSYVATAVFALIYCWLMAWWMHPEATTPSASKQAGAGLVLAIPVVLTVPSAGTWSVVFLPFIAALVIFTTPLWPGLLVGVAIWLVPTLTAFIAIEQEVWMLAGPGFGMLFILVSRLTEHYDARARAAEEQLNQAEERDRIARDVHDVLGHSLTVLSIKAQVARRLMDSDPQRAQTELDEIERLARESLGQVRSTVTRLKAPQLPGELDVARSALQASDITADIRAADDHSQSAMLAWGLREAVTNVLRHSQASKCVIDISADRLRVTDDGRGANGTGEGNGIRGLRERAKKEGAQVMVGPAYPELEGTTAEQPGTKIEVRLP